MNENLAVEVCCEIIAKTQLMLQRKVDALEDELASLENLHVDNDDCSPDNLLNRVRCREQKLAQLIAMICQQRLAQAHQQNMQFLHEDVWHLHCQFLQKKSGNQGSGLRVSVGGEENRLRTLSTSCYPAQDSTRLGFGVASNGRGGERKVRKDSFEEETRELERYIEPFRPLIIRSKTGHFV